MSRVLNRRTLSPLLWGFLVALVGVALFYVAVWKTNSEVGQFRQDHSCNGHTACLSPYGTPGYEQWFDVGILGVGIAIASPVAGLLMSLWRLLKPARPPPVPPIA